MAEPTLNPLVIARREWSLIREHVFLRASWRRWMVPCSIYSWFQGHEVAANYGIWQGTAHTAVILAVMLSAVLIAYCIARYRTRKAVRAAQPLQGEAWWLKPVSRRSR